jgi:gamma-glutamyl hydrolase
MEETYDLMDDINGVVFPGGEGDDAYETFERQIFEKAIELNDAGTYFPIFGICLGMQHITKYITGTTYLEERTLN